MMAGLHLAVDGSGLARPHAGVGTYTREVLRAMAAARPRHRMTVFLPPGAHPPWQADSVVYRNLPSTRLVGRHLRWPALIRHVGVDAYFGPAGLMPLGRLGVPAVVTVHDLAIYIRREWFPAGQPLNTRWVVPGSIRRADRLLAVSANTARDIKAVFGVSGSRVRVVHLGVSPAFRPLEPDRLAGARERFGLAPGFVLFVGAIEPRKNLDTLLQAWAMLPDRPPLVVAGGWGWRYQATRARIERLGPGIRVLGEVSEAELQLLYNLAACLAHPAWYEGFGLTPLEAMACGLPVITSDAASLPEVVGDAGMMVPPGDPEMWRQALERVLREPAVAGDLRRRGVLRAAEFSWEAAAEGAWAAIEEVCGQDRV